MAFLWVLAGCKTLDVPTEPTLISSSSGLLVGKKRWESCNLMWSVGSNIGGNAANAPNAAIAAAFDAFNKTGTFLNFQKNTTTIKTNITIVLSGEAQMPKTNTEGLFTYKTSPLAYCSGTVQGGFIILINTTNKWTASQLQSVIMNQLGEVLGLPISTDPTALMYARLNKDAPTIQLKTTDLAALRALYPASGLPVVTTSQPFLVTNTLQNTKEYHIEAPIANADNIPPLLSAGCCFSTTNANPTIENSKYTESYSFGVGFKTANTALENLQANTRYYLRAYVRNACGTGYGQTITFIKP